MLGVFAAVNAALWLLEGREPAASAFCVPRWVPGAGAVVCVVFVIVGVLG